MEQKPKGSVEKGAVAKQSWLGGDGPSPGEESVPLTPKAGSRERNEFTDAWLAKGTATCRAE